MDISTTGSLSVVWSDFTEDIKLGDRLSSSLIFLETLSGVCEREEPGLDRGEMVADGLFLWLKPCEEL